MKLTSIFLQNFRGFKEGITFRFEEGVNLLVGENGTGKSSALNSIEWCLFGREIEKRASGLHERKDWEVAHRGVDGSPTVVRLTFETSEGDVVIARSRDAKAKRTTEDSFQVQFLDGQLLSQGNAAEWLTDIGFPSWSDWKCCHCQHQEAARDRLIDKENRTASLAALLGLDDIMEVRKALDELRLPAAKTELKRIESRNADALQELLQSTLASKTHQSSGAYQVAPEAVTREQAMQDASALLTDAERLNKKLGLTIELPTSFSDLNQALDWADRWPTTVRSDPGRLAELDGLRKEHGALAGMLAKIEPLSKATAESEVALRDAIHAEGNLEHRQTTLQTAQSEVKKIDDIRKANHRLCALIHDAAEVLAEHPSDTCPVCESAVPDLPERLQVRLQDMSSQIAEKLKTSLNEARAAENNAQKSLDALNRLFEQVKTVERNLQTEIDNLSRVITEVKDDPIAAAKGRREVLQQQIKQIEPLATERDEILDQHRRRTERLRAISRYLYALQHHNQRVDLKSLPTWAKFQQALNDMASLIVDCEAIAALVRQLQKESSDSRLASVNTCLGKYFRMITGEENAELRGLQVRAKITAKKIDYNVIDADGQPLVPVLNQAALNAVSMSMLFAQAAEGADGGGPNILVLDDPEQSLDQEHVNGLAKAIEDAAGRGAVLVGVPPGRLEKRIEEFADCPKHFIHLNECNLVTTASAGSQEHGS